MLQWTNVLPNLSRVPDVPENNGDLAVLQSVPDRPLQWTQVAEIEDTHRTNLVSSFEIVNALSSDEVKNTSLPESMLVQTHWTDGTVDEDAFTIRGSGDTRDVFQSSTSEIHVRLSELCKNLPLEPATNATSSASDVQEVLQPWSASPSSSTALSLQSQSDLQSHLM